jgi:hypothetical protein
MYSLPSMSPTYFLSVFLYQMAISVFLKRFCKPSLISPWSYGKYNICTTLNQTCHIARDYPDSQGKLKIYMGNHTSTTKKI